MPKKIFTQELEGTRRRGRPRKGWREEVERDLQSAGSEKMDRVGDRQGKMEKYCSTGQSPQRAATPKEEEEEDDDFSASLHIFERKIFRRIYGPKYEDGEWKSRTNRELEELSKGENIVKWIKGQRIIWLGHL